MNDDTRTSTLEVEGFTPYAQIPQWVLRSGGKIPAGAVHLYGVIMTYADNTTRAAFPSRERLAADMGVSVSTVGRFIKALEDSGAITVQRRRNARTGNFYANHYVLRFTQPAAQEQTCRSEPEVTSDPRREVTSDTRTRPTILTTPTNTSNAIVDAREKQRTPSTAADDLSLHTQTGLTEESASSTVSWIFENIYQPRRYYYGSDDSEAWDLLAEALGDFTGEDILSIFEDKRWDERLFEIIEKDVSDGKTVRYGISQWLAQLVNWTRVAA